MKPQTIIKLIQSIFLLPVFMVVVYVGAWIAFLAAPLLIGAGVVFIIYLLLSDLDDTEEEKEKGNK